VDDKVIFFKLAVVVQGLSDQSSSFASSTKQDNFFPMPLLVPFGFFGLLPPVCIPDWARELILGSQ
jgi:hypothetical protein